MGIMYDALRTLETYVNEKLKTKSIKVAVTFIPVRPDQVEGAHQIWGINLCGYLRSL